ncbi:MAG: SRPBCC family protein [Sandaracinaceae bacterium]
MELTQTFELDAPASDVWHLLGERYGEVADWASGLDGSRRTGELGVGCVRVCESPANWPFPAGIVKERIEWFDRGSRELTYRAFDGLPGFLVSALNRWRVEPVDEMRCRLHMHATLELSALASWCSPVFRLATKRMGRVFVRDLRQHLSRSASMEVVAK